ncbi:Mu transposase C-terminal domain-containing protein [Bacillus salipaludis]|nr:Mu transposase C-terminal domain-containing protein [Bacillus salipaludis]
MKNNNMLSDRSRIQKEVEFIIERTIKCFYLRKESFSITSIHEIVWDRIREENKNRGVEDQLKLPSFSTIRRRLKCWDRSDFDLNEKINKASYPLERVWVEHTILEVLVIDDESGIPIGRPTFTAIIDEYTGCILGYHLSFEAPSSDSVLRALRHAIYTKQYIDDKYPEIKNKWVAHGVPQTLMVENSKEFISKSFVEACNKIGIILHYYPIAKQRFKGQVEQHFRMIKQHLLEINTDPVDFKSIGNQSFNPNKNAGVIRLNKLHKLLHQWIVDCYGQKYQKVVRGIPSKLWKRSEPVQTEPSFESMIAILPKKKSRVQAFGIRYLCLYYLSAELHSLHDKKREDIEFHYNPDDLSEIYVYDELQKKYLVVPCTNPEYSDGLNKEKHCLNLRQIKAEENRARLELLEAKQKMIEIKREETLQQRQATLSSNEAADSSEV